ncbi:MAG: tRNA (adenosine(37)-N6)-dimethylallyltransferase MiaA [Niabella sp.]
MSSRKTLIVVAGPTAVGKTALAIEIAKHYHTQILSADSRQCYKELNIGVARPSPQELAAVPHHFIASHSIKDDINAAWYEAYGLDVLEKIFSEHPVAVVVGGTGLYIKALTQGLDEIPPIPEDIRKGIAQIYSAKGISWLQQELAEKDPLFDAHGEMQNPQRMMRALEVLTVTGKSILHYRSQTPKSRAFNTLLIGLQRPRQQLYDAINTRVLQMMQDGLMEEARGLIPYRHLNALQTVGYKEMFDFFDGNISLDRAIELIQQNTRHYAKRQMTWFSKQPGIQWFEPQDFSEIVNYIDALI